MEIEQPLSKQLVILLQFFLAKIGYLSKSLSNIPALLHTPKFKEGKS